MLISKYFHFEGFANCSERTSFSQTLFQENKGHFKSHHVQDNCLPVFSGACLLASYYQFSSVTQSCLTLCNPMDYSMPGHHQLPEFTHPTVSSSAITFSFCFQSFSTSGSFPVSQFFASGGQSIEVSASASFLPVNIQD